MLFNILRQIDFHPIWNKFETKSLEFKRLIEIMKKKEVKTQVLRCKLENFEQEFYSLNFFDNKLTNAFNIDDVL